MQGVKHLSSRLQGGKWAQSIGKLLVLSIVLFVGLLLGVLATLHMPDYVNYYRRNSVDLVMPDLIMVAGSDNSMWGGNTLNHTLSDPELLWLASMVPQREPPKKRVNKVAFMFMTRGPLPLSPLWEMFFKDNEGKYSIYVHTSPGFILDVPETSVFHGRQIPSQITQWGDITMCDAERRLLGNALLDFSNQRFVLLSETCAPLYNFSTLYAYLMNSKHSFVGVFDDPGRYGRGRYNPSMSPDVTLEQWRKGSQWFEVNRKHAVFLVSDRRYYGIFRMFCKPACYVDEHYIPTVLSIKFGPEISNRSITAVDWSRGGSHPAMFGQADISREFLQRFRDDNNCSYNGEYGHICYFFARKFSPNALAPLQELLGSELTVPH